MERVSLAADSSQISDFMKCPRLWYYKYIRNLEFSGAERNLAFDKGTLVHALFDYYYQRMPNNPMQIANEAILHFRKNVDKLGVPKSDVDLIVSRFMAYSQMYSNDFQPLIINGKPQVEVGFSVPILDTSTFYFVLEGRIDLITNQEVFVDHKTQSRKYDHYKFTPQFLTYSLATGLSHGCINYFSLADTVNKDTFRRSLFTVNNDVRERWKKKVIEIFHKMAYCKITGKFDMNEVSCQDNFGICQFAKLDEETNPKMVEIIIKQQYRQREEWKPWRLNGDGKDDKR